ncbi:hypothetical protein Cs7R123_60830 [Catellatospora sp. TT07R-123]|uniref:hypothetical protein n=1 Tax=Catellatospora sp. TT07R-123 TaxID=2733863 RepID=UPI001B200A57|nr:hypothetical protein [Catellatospora sp. TT07R-123]GHJ48741.1 hypothetical protein Cs7R123_60830 [Catellatospora sp. TT07R-123]
MSGNRWLKWGLGALVAVAVGVGLAAMLGSSYPPLSDIVDTQNDTSGVAEPVEGTDLSRVTLQPDAVEHLGIVTAPVAMAKYGSKQKLTIPYKALFYDPTGATWAYAVVGDRVYLRQPVTVETVAGDTVVLSAGPKAGTQVVVQGVDELYGTEVGVEEE